MSPPLGSPLGRSQQEGIPVFKEIDALDGLVENGTDKRSCSPKSNAVFEKAIAATEHEDGGHFQDENMDKYMESASADRKALELVDWPDSSSPPCLGEVQSEEDDCNSYPGHFESPSGLEWPRRNSFKFTRRGKRKKGKSSGKASKRRRVSYSYGDFGSAKLNLVGCLKSAGNETKAAQSNTSRSSGSGKCGAVKSKATLAPRTSGSGTNLGGTGDGGEDGEDPHKNWKPRQHDCVPTVKKFKKRRKQEDGMEIDDEAPLGEDGVDCAVVKNPTTKAQMMLIADGAAKTKMSMRQEGRPLNSSRGPPVEQKAVNEVKIRLNCQLNHSAKQSNICKQSNCQICYWVHNLLDHYEEQLKNSCTCSACKLCPVLLKFHLNNCKLPECYICLKFEHLKRSSSETNIQNAPKPVPNQACDGQCVLNAPISGASLDQEEDKIIWKDDGLEGLAHFREHQDYVIKKGGFVGRGGHGQVHEVVLDLHQKTHDCFASNQKFVIKKTTIKDDEIKVISNIANHPNFVKTYLIVNKNDGNFKQIVMMEKCDKSLREYLNEHARTGKTLEIEEAMHYWTQVLDAVVHLHNLPIPVVHKDIKPGNVLLTYTTNLVRAKLADFDAVKLLHNEFTMPGLTPEGTLGFIAPEVLQRRVHGRPADMYSMGIFLLELRFEEARKQPEIAIQKLKKIDSDLGELIERCLEPDQFKRPTAVELQTHAAVKKYGKSTGSQMSVCAEKARQLSCGGNSCETSIGPHFTVTSHCSTF